MTTVVLFLDLKGSEIGSDVGDLVLLVYFLDFLELLLVDQFACGVVDVLLVVEEHLVHPLLFLDEHHLLLFHCIFIVDLQFHLFLFL